MILEFPMVTVSELNQREHWRTRHRRRASQRREVNAEWRKAFGQKKIELPCVVTLTRIAPRMLDFGDNLAASFKATRDEIAALLGVDDNSPLIKWQYRQEQVNENCCAVRIEVESIN